MFGRVACESDEPSIPVVRSAALIRPVKGCCNRIPRSTLEKTAR